MEPTLQQIDNAHDDLKRALERAARQMAPYTKGAGHEEEDLIQEGYLLIPKIVETYNPIHGISLDMYARIVFKRRFIALGRRARLKPDPEIETRVDQQGFKAWAAEESRQLVSDVMSQILPHDRQGCLKRQVFAAYHFEDYTLSELALRHDKSMSCIFTWIKQGEADFATMWKRGDA